MHVTLELKRALTSQEQGALRNFLAEWPRRNATWERRWSSRVPLHVVSVEQLVFSTQFSAPPCLVGVDDSKIVVELRGRPAATLWRDWLIHRLLPQLQALFPVDGIVGLKNAAVR